MPGLTQVPVGAGDEDDHDGNGLDRISSLSLSISADGPDSSAHREPPHTVVIEYFIEYCREYAELRDLRRQNPAAGQIFHRERETAMQPDKKAERCFFNMMKDVGEELNKTMRGALRIQEKPPPARPRILNMGMAPGGFLKVALRLNRTAHAVALTLPISQGGYRAHVPPGPDVDVRYVDVGMLAADLGVDDVLAERARPRELLPRQFAPGQEFDLVICGGSVVRHNHDQTPRSQEPVRLSMSQLVLGLERLVPGGTVIVLLHKLDAWETVLLIYTFSRLSKVRLFKPVKAHGKKSSFYMVATGVQSKDPAALRATEVWKQRWKSTFEPEAESGKKAGEVEEQPSAEEVLEAFGDDLVRMGRKVWEIQANELRNAFDQ